MMNDSEETAELLRELREISNRFSNARTTKTLSSSHSTPPAKGETLPSSDDNPPRQNPTHGDDPGKNENGNNNDEEKNTIASLSSISKSSSSDPFIGKYSENSGLNQYWYSQSTIRTLCDAIVDVISDEHSHIQKIAFLSTPSLYFGLPSHYRKHCFLFEFDQEAWKHDRGYIFYDYNNPGQIPSNLHGSFDMVVIDPPFITRSVWEHYANAYQILCKPNKTGAGKGFALCTTVLENAATMKELFGVEAVTFSPSIPNLVYQYSTFANFTSERLNESNPEILL